MPIGRSRPNPYSLNNSLVSSVACRAAFGFLVLNMSVTTLVYSDPDYTQFEVTGSRDGPLWLRRNCGSGHKSEVGPRRSSVGILPGKEVCLIQHRGIDHPSVVAVSRTETI